jgi:hypothetical protein
MRVRFIQRYCGYWPGANPILCEPELSQLLAAGVCEPFDKPAPKAPKPVAVEEPTEVEEEVVEVPEELKPHPLRRGRRK